MSVYALAFRPDGKRLAVGVQGRAVLYDTASWRIAEVFVGAHGAVRSLTFHPDGKRLSVGSGRPGLSGNLALWDPTDSYATRHYRAADDTIEGIAYSTGGAHLLTASSDSRARYYPVALAPYTFDRLDEHNGRVTSVAFSPKPETVFVTGALDKMAKVWDMRTLKVVANFDQAAGGITGVAFLPGGEQFVGASLDGNLYWWGFSVNARRRTVSGYAIRTVRAHPDGIAAFGASADGQRVITGGVDQKVRILRLDNGGTIRTIAGPAAPLYAAALSADGALAAAGGHEGRVWVWDVASGRLLATLFPTERP